MCHSPQLKNMHLPAFSSSFTTTLPAVRTNPVHSLNPRVSAQTVVSASRPPDAPSVDITPKQALPLFATGLAALSVLLGVAPVSAEPASKLHSRHEPDSLTTSHSSHLRRSSMQSTAVRVHSQPKKNRTHSPSSSFLVEPAGDSAVRQGSLLVLEPAPTAYTADANFPSDTSRNDQWPVSSSARNQTASSRPTNTIPEWRASKTNSSIYSPGHVLFLRRRMRPATIGLVGFGAFTSGSVFLRSLTQKKNNPIPLSAIDKPSEMCSVVCMHIPFCVPERHRLLHGLTQLADSACLVTPSGMAAAARDAAALLLKESGLLEDSTKFAPSMDVCMADSLMQGARRFSGHVEIEKHRIDRLSGRHLGYDVSPKAKLGQYGVVTLVVATAVGVNMDCYDKRTPVVCRLRAALDAVCRLETRDVAGLELRWIPEAKDSRSLTRAQLADSFPCLRVI